MCVYMRVSVRVCVCLHVYIFLTLLSIQGIAMANRKFDTYMPGASEQLEAFLNSIMSGRYIFFVIKVHNAFHVCNCYAKNCKI